jgi:hypothetical protein
LEKNGYFINFSRILTAFGAPISRLWIKRRFVPPEVRRPAGTSAIAMTPKGTLFF